MNNATHPAPVLDIFNATFDRIAESRGLAGIQPSDPRWDEVQDATAAELGIRECSRCGEYGIDGDSRECVECGRDGSYCISDVDQACWCHECTVYAEAAMRDAGLPPVSMARYATDMHEAGRGHLLSERERAAVVR